jgi:hypothetical protein
MTLEELGFTKEELQERVVEQAVCQLMRGVSYDEDGNPCDVTSGFKRKLDESLRKQIDTAINQLAEKHVLPNITSYLESLTLQETNKWGEKTKKSLTFIEYLVQRAEAYMVEEVDHNGKSKAESNDSWWRGSQTRVAFLINQHLQYNIKSAMEDALKSANSQIAIGIAETVKLQLKDLLEKIKPAVVTR